MITYNPERKTFKLDTKDSSYIFGLNEDGILLHYYYGKKIGEDAVAYLAVADGSSGVTARPHYAPGSTFSLDLVPQEYPTFGAGDHRPSALRIRDSKGNPTTLIHYVSHDIYKGKPKIPGIPATFGTEDEVMTLEVHTVDRFTNAAVTLFYSVFSDSSVMTRHTRVENKSETALDIESAQSACVDYNTSDYDVITLYGHAVFERNFERTPLSHMTHEIASLRGSSSHNFNPFMAIVSHGTTEESGEAYGYNLVYSGNFRMDAAVDGFSAARVLMGIHPDGFNWHLEPGESFYTPEAVMVYTDGGIGEMSRIFHRFYLKHLMKSPWTLKKRPCLINNWEGTYMRFDEEKIVAIAEAAAKCGVEMLVLDDGWFGKRNNDRCSLGDWVVFEEKLPYGMGHLSDRIHALGMKFGLWFEPEMVSPDSDLYRAHPDWALHTEGRPMSLGRHQLVLDYSRPEVVDYIFDSMCKILDNAKIEYVKWDFNRNLTEVGSEIFLGARQQEVFHRYVLGVYDLLERLTARYPDLLIEGCSAGGGRFDPGMLYYVPQIWTSDNSDAIERLNIQFGTSMCYPTASMGAHVSASPNHQMKRLTSLETRGNVALSGTFGYELDSTKLSEEECAQITEQVKTFHELYDVIHYGDMYRLVAPYEGERSAAAWEYVAEDKSEAVFFYVVIRSRYKERRFVRLRGLDPDRHYKNEQTGEILLGSTLMHAGLNIVGLAGDGASLRYHFKAVD